MMKTSGNRCCGSGVCIINDAGECWCGQVWNGEQMVSPSLNVKSIQTHSQNLMNDSDKDKDE
ncbi:hypothetical protein [Polynucleobacter necessarius]|uniref:hypothetical protein n=1 Tax=Polynucleobacter necessarius TaxID=576610 RepID=UPI0018D54E24|nr:hypothetical protein [Polynucleobacter necessarius]